MCGIAGIVDRVPPDRDLLRSMCDLIRHRGPDSDGFYIGDCVGLGVRRLRVIDLESGDQPIHNEDKTVWLVFNGEIYNHRSLRKQLEGKGHVFYTESDTETLVHLYEEFGLEFARHLNGIFAFALWDTKERQLVLARDYFGVKPLHYVEVDGRLVFGSEIKSLLLDPHVEPRLNHQGLHLFLNQRYIPGEDTLFADIRRLPSGHVLVWKNSSSRMHRYWRPEPSAGGPSSEAEYIEGIRHYLSEAVRKQLMSDVPLGVYLSGGLDSSSITAFAVQHRSGGLESFCLGFNEPTDELNDARVVADHFGTLHREICLDVDPLRYFPEVIWHAEEPKENILQGFLLSRFAKQHVTVALSGLGGDELFAGYINNLYMGPSQPFHKLVPASLRALVLRPLSGAIFNLQNRSYLRRLDEYRRGLQLLLSVGDPALYYLILRNAWDHDRGQYDNVYSPRLAAAVVEGCRPTRDYFDPYFQKRTDIVAQALVAEFHTKMVEDFLANEDRVSMANSLEVRVPFLDRDLVEFASSIPTNLKLRGLSTKDIFKKAMKGLLPDHTLEKKKWGFSFDPYYQFQKDLKSVAERILTPERVRQRDIFNYEYLRQILDARPHRRLRWHYFFLWNAVGLEIWMQMFLDGNPADPDFAIESYYAD